MTIGDGKMELRDYQIEAVDALYEMIFTERESNPLVLCPTGSGKSAIFCAFILNMLEQFNGMRFMVVTHRKKLIQQNYKTLKAMSPRIDSVLNKADEFGIINIICVDECHLVDDKEKSRYMRFFDGLKKNNDKLRIVGFTATGWRLGMGKLTNGKIFTHVAYDLCSRDQYCV